MITALIIIMGSVILKAVLSVFSLATFLVPDHIQIAMAHGIAYARAFNGWLPVDDMLSAFAFYVKVIMVLFIIKLGLRLISIIPGIKNVNEKKTT